MTDEPRRGAEGRHLRALALGGAARVIVVEVTDLVRETADRHGLLPHATAAAGVLTAATALLAAHMEGEERLALQLQATVPACAWFGEMGADGVFRARFGPPDLDPRGLVTGALLAIKSVAGREVYRGVTEVRAETIEEALQRHLRKSSQVEGVVRLTSVVSSVGVVDFVGGILVERLPPADGLPSISSDEFEERTRWLLKTRDVDQHVLEAIGGRFGDESIEVVHEHLLRWACRCSLSRVEGMLTSLGPDELRSLLAEQGQAEVTCHFCNERRVVPGWRLEELASGVASA